VVGDQDLPPGTVRSGAADAVVASACPPGAPLVRKLVLGAERQEDASYLVRAVFRTGRSSNGTEWHPERELAAILTVFSVGKSGRAA